MRSLEVLPSPKQFLGKSEETLTCVQCQETWTRISRRGRKPSLCPTCVEDKVNRPTISESGSLAESQARMAYARSKKAEAQREAAKRASLAEAVQRQRIAEQLPRVSEMWNVAFTFACEANTEAAWNRCETLMTSYINMRKAA